MLILIKYFEVEEPKFDMFYLLLKIRKSLRGVPGRPVIWMWYRKFTACLDFYLQPIAVKGY